MSIVEARIMVAKTARHYADIAYKEGGGDDSIFGKWYGGNGAPWCAMFVSYCFAQAKATKLIAAQSKKGFASCSAATAWFKKNGRLIPTGTATKGDIAFMNFSGGSSSDHVGIVLSVNKITKTMKTVEGNTVNPDGTGDQAHGDGVYLKTRPFSCIVAVARPDWDALTS